jgi:nucleoside-diphosphate-sugar epimerase
MHCIVAGTGYTGARILAAIGDSVGISREAHAFGDDQRFIVRDLDQDFVEPLEFDAQLTMIYSVPPAAEISGESRLQRLLQAIKPSLKRIVYFSTTGVYGDHCGKLTSETSRTEPENPRAKRRLSDEQHLLDYNHQHHADIVILRIPGIYGPERLGVSRIRSGTPFIQEADACPGNRIHVDDLVQCAIAAAKPDTPPGIYNVGDGDHMSSVAFANCVAELAGIPAPVTVSREEALATFSETRLSFLRESRTLDTSKMRDILGVTPRYGDPQDGVRASLQEEGFL